MLRHKNIDRICCAVLVATILITCCFMGAAAAGLVEGDNAIGYEDRLFDQSRVHTIDIVMDDWAAFLDTCTSEVYSNCTVIIDGESYGNAGIRGKGNTSLSSVASYGNDRYSFKIEFDQYQPGRTYHGLDKLSLNNIIQDKTYLKDYVSYTLMNKMGVAAPLCSFAQIRVNGEDWGFYLAVEGVEDAFLQRNYGSSGGELYKPDSMSFGGGRGNGRDFDMDAFAEQFGQNTSSGEDGRRAVSEENDTADSAVMQMPGGFDPSEMPGGGMPGGFDTFSGIPEDFDPSGMEAPRDFGFDAMGGSDKDGRGSDDVKLQYIDDDPDSYANIFGNAKTDVTEADQDRLIASLKILSEGEDIESVVDVEAVIRYFVVHNFLCNDDSYTGQMIHNYYLYEEDGVMSMIPWDYNLAFGGFSMGGRGDSSGATSTVNAPIDSLVSSGDISSRPMAAWIFEDETYIAMYHEIYAEFIAQVFGNGWFESELGRVIEMIDPYVQADKNGFFSYKEFRTGVSALEEFCALRAQSITGQLDGSIPSTAEAQRSGSAALIDASHIDLSDLGEFGMGGGKTDVTAGDFPGMSGKRGSPEGASAVPEAEADIAESRAADKAASETAQNPMPGGFAPGAAQGQVPGGFDSGMMQGQMPGGFDPGMMQGQVPGEFDPGMMQGQIPGGPVPETVLNAGAEQGINDAVEGTAKATDEPANAAGAVAAESEQPTGEGEAGSAAVLSPSSDFGQSGGGRIQHSNGGRQTPDFSMDPTGMGGSKQSSGENMPAMLIGSVALLIAALLLAKFFKGKF